MKQCQIRMTRKGSLCRTFKVVKRPTAWSFVLSLLYMPEAARCPLKRLHIRAVPSEVQPADAADERPVLGQYCSRLPHGGVYLTTYRPTQRPLRAASMGAKTWRKLRKMRPKIELFPLLFPLFPLVVESFHRHRKFAHQSDAVSTSTQLMYSPCVCPPISRERE